MANGCALRVRISGEGDKTIVLLHGYLKTIEVWEEFIPLLKGVRVVAIDLPGHGISEIKGEVHTMEFLARTVHAALAELGITVKSYIVGHSMGGYAALEFIRIFPEAAAGIVLLHSTPNADTPEKREQRQREIELVLSGKKELIARTNPAARFAAENRKRLAPLIAELSEEVFFMDDEGITALLRGMAQRPDNNDMLRSSAVPQLFIFGRGDEHIPVAVAEEVAARHPQAQIVWLEHSGHMGMMEEPEATAKAIMDFVEAN